MADTLASPNTNINQTDYYALLGVARDAETTDIRQQYRAALLRIHPDKQNQSYTQDYPSPVGIAISQLQEAFRTLSDRELRVVYDQLLKEGKEKAALATVKQRPANEVSLDEFTLEEVAAGDGEMMSRWTYPCRCGSLFIIKEQELEEGVHYIGCGGCSEVVWVGYEAIDDVLDHEDNELQLNLVSPPAVHGAPRRSPGLLCRFARLPPAHPASP